MVLVSISTLLHNEHSQNHFTTIVNLRFSKHRLITTIKNVNSNGGASFHRLNTTIPKTKMFEIQLEKGRGRSRSKRTEATVGQV